ncbi:hypothetical protein DL765_005003 [Monosporascus sp. GIB2]|nr:hypothetical protein DL765_005003 [Monosporascus sp. GIB2]
MSPETLQVMLSELTRETRSLLGWDASPYSSPITRFLFGPVDNATQANDAEAGWFKADAANHENGMG